MLKLYRSAGDGAEYWEAWDNGSSAITVHWGQLGTVGETVDVPLEGSETADSRIEAEAREPRSAGFQEIGEDDLATVVVQYAREPEKRARRGIEKRIDKIERRVNEALGWTGLGHCDDADFSVDFATGTPVAQLTVIAKAVDADLALTVLRDDLAAHDLLTNAVIAIEEDDEYVVHWPEAQRGRVII